MRSLLLFLCLTGLAGAQQALPERDASWQLVWSDEFNQNGAPDSKVWDFETGFERNHGLQWYQRDNVSCRDGLLFI